MYEAPQMRHARLRLCLSISPESSAANQLLLARALARRPLCSERLFFATWQDLWLSPIRHLRSEVAKRLLRTPFVHLHQGAFQRLLIRRPTPLVVVRREPAMRLCPPLW